MCWPDLAKDHDVLPLLSCNQQRITSLSLKQYEPSSVGSLAGTNSTEAPTGTEVTAAGWKAAVYTPRQQENLGLEDRYGIGTRGHETLFWCVRCVAAVRVLVSPMGSPDRPQRRLPAT